MPQDWRNDARSDQKQHRDECSADPDRFQGVHEAFVQVVGVHEEHHQRNDDQVLNQRNTDHGASGERHHTVVHGQALEHDCGTGGNECGAGEQCRVAGNTEKAFQNAENTQERGENLNDRTPDRQLPDGADVVKRELKPHGEKKQRHADIGEPLQLILVDDDPVCPAVDEADRDSGEDISEQERLSEAFCDPASDQPSDQDCQKCRYDAHLLFCRLQ